jgi:hypothetical protein
MSDVVDNIKELRNTRSHVSLRMLPGPHKVEKLAELDARVAQLEHLKAQLAGSSEALQSAEVC